MKKKTKFDSCIVHISSLLKTGGIFILFLIVPIEVQVPRYSFKIAIAISIIIIGIGIYLDFFIEKKYPNNGYREYSIKKKKSIFDSYIMSIGFLLITGVGTILSLIILPALHTPNYRSNVAIAICLFFIILGICLVFFIGKKYPDDDDWGD